MTSERVAVVKGRLRAEIKAGAGSQLRIGDHAMERMTSLFIYSFLCLSIRELRGAQSAQRSGVSLASDIALKGIAFTYF